MKRGPMERLPISSVGCALEVRSLDMAGEAQHRRHVSASGKRCSPCDGVPMAGVGVPDAGATAVV